MNANGIKHTIMNYNYLCIPGEPVSCARPQQLRSPTPAGHQGLCPDTECLPRPAAVSHLDTQPH